METITPIIKTLETAWKAIQAAHPDCPKAVILTAPALKKNVVGHFAAERWANSEGSLHEVVVTAEYLGRTAVETMGTLLHEAAHAINQARGVRDVSSHQYHNKHFQRVAKEIGLAVAKYPNRGWAQTAMTKELEVRYADEIKALEAVLKLYRRTPNKSKGKTKSRLIKASCGCGHIIRLSRKVFQATGIVCDTCGQHFSLTD